MDKRFIIDVGEFLYVTTPYSDIHFKYDNINDVIEDLSYCLECEVKDYGKDNEKKKR